MCHHDPDRNALPRGACASCVATWHPDGLTLEEIGELLGCTRERVRQIEAAAIEKVQRAVARIDGDLAEDVRRRREESERAAVEARARRLHASAAYLERLELGHWTR